VNWPRSSSLQGSLSNAVKIGDASVAYDEIDVQSLQGTCLTAGAKLESAFNNYAATVSTWNDCIFDYDCDVDSDVLPGMQVKWAAASEAIDRATELVESLNPDSPNFRADGDAGDGA
jgi:hypothetical protein